MTAARLAPQGFAGYSAPKHHPQPIPARFEEAASKPVKARNKNEMILPEQFTAPDIAHPPVLFACAQWRAIC